MRTQKEQRADANFWYKTKKGKPMIQPALGVRKGTEEEMRQEVLNYCERNGYTLTMLWGFKDRK